MHAEAIHYLTRQIDLLYYMRHTGDRAEMRRVIRSICGSVRLMQRPETHRQLRNMQAQLSRLGMRRKHVESRLGDYDRFMGELARLRRLEHSFNIVRATSDAAIREHSARADAFAARAEVERLLAEVASLRGQLASTAPTADRPTASESVPRRGLPDPAT